MGGFVLALVAPAHARPVVPDAPYEPSFDADVDADTDTAADEPTPPEPTPDEPPAPQDRWARWRIAGGIGVRFGSFFINGDSTGTAIPFHLDLGVRHRRLFLYAGYDVLGVDLDPPPAPATARGATAGAVGDGSGLVHRLGANARYAVGRLAESDGGLEVWAEAGVGVQHVRWDAGGVWTRSDLALGIGGTMLGLGHHEHGGLSIGLRVMISPRTDTAGAPPVCGGPCDRATPPPAWDRSFLFDMTVPFGN